MFPIITSRTSALRSFLGLLGQANSRLVCTACSKQNLSEVLVGPNPNSSNVSIRWNSSKPANQLKQRTGSLLLEELEEEAKHFRPISQQIVPTTEQVLQTDASLKSPDYFQVHNLFTVRDLFDARVHLGHKVGSLHPRMTDFIFGSRFESVVFDLDKTAFHLRQALNFAAHIAYRKGIILFVTRSPHTMNLVEQTAIESGEYAHCREWHTHIMTNSENKFGGTTRLPDLIILFNTLDTVMATHKAAFDANKMLIPTIGIVDSNCDPNVITYPVPGNDDTLSAVQFYCKVFKEAILRGKQKRKNLEIQQLANSSASNTNTERVES